MKEAEVRWQETIQFIKEHPLAGFEGHWDLMIEGLEEIPETTWSELSPLMSQVGVPHRPTKEQDRSYRRASILLGCAFKKQKIWANTIAEINRTTSNFKGVYSAIYLAPAVDIVFSMEEIAEKNFESFIDDPRQFLTDYMVNVSGKPEGKKLKYKFYMDNGIYNFDCSGPNKTGYDFYAINVPVVLSTNLPDDASDMVATLANKVDPKCGLVLTTELSGCCYCFMADGNKFAAAHIKPKGISASDLFQRLRAEGGFSNGNEGNFNAYGQLAPHANGLGYPDGRLSVIVAVKQGSTWRVFAQIRDHEKQHILDVIEFED